MGCVKKVVQTLAAPFVNAPSDPRNSVYSGPGYTPPPGTTTTATPGPQVQTGAPPQGGFRVLGVRPTHRPGMPGFTVPGPGVPPTAARPPDDKGGAGPGTDATRGLLKKPGASRTLLT